MRITRYPGLTLLVSLGALVGAAGCIGTIGGDGPSEQSDGTGESAQALCEAGVPDAGRSGLRRLNAHEYRRALELALPVVEDFELPSLPADETTGAYDNNATTAVGELDVERYEAVAEALATQLGPELEELLPCEVEPEDEGACARAFLTDLSTKLFRRPPSDEQLAALMGVWERGSEDATFGDGLLLAVRALLQAPAFLYHIEEGTQTVDNNVAVARLDAHTLAARLAFALWQTGPDDELLEAAEDRSLLEPEVLEAQAERMLEGERGAEALAHFAAQWLGYEELDGAPKNGEMFPDYGPELVRDMRDEMDALVEHVVLDGDGRLATLLTTREAFVTSRLAEVYDLDEQEGWVELPEDRAGVLTRAAFLAAHAHPSQTSPVLRGIEVRKQLLCQPPPPPPPDVDDTAPPVDPDLTTRERFAQHTESASCAGCHALIDPIGFGFESYDAIGRFRTMDGKHEVDARGELVQTDVDGEFEGAVELSSKLASSRQVQDCVAAQWFTYAIGRAPSQADACSLEGVQSRFAASDGDLRELIIGLVTSDAFRHYRIETGEEQ